LDDNQLIFTFDLAQVLPQFPSTTANSLSDAMMDSGTADSPGW